MLLESLPVVCDLLHTWQHEWKEIIPGQAFHIILRICIPFPYRIHATTISSFNDNSCWWNAIWYFKAYDEKEHKCSCTLHTNCKNAVIFHAHFNFFSQLRRFSQQFYIWATICTGSLEKSLQFCVKGVRSTMMLRTWLSCNKPRNIVLLNVRSIYIILTKDHYY